MPLARARTQKILNLPNCLYTKKTCKFFQSYEKSSAEHDFVLKRTKSSELVYFLCRAWVSSKKLVSCSAVRKQDVTMSGRTCSCVKTLINFRLVYCCVSARESRFRNHRGKIWLYFECCHNCLTVSMIV